MRTASIFAKSLVVPEALERVCSMEYVLYLCYWVHQMDVTSGSIVLATIRIVDAVLIPIYQTLPALIRTLKANCTGIEFDLERKTVIIINDKHFRLAGQQL